MKTILGTFLALGLLTSGANAQYCAPGFGHKMPEFSKPVKKVEIVKPVAEAPAPVAEPVPAPEQVPQK